MAEAMIVAMVDNSAHVGQILGVRIASKQAPDARVKTLSGWHIRQTRREGDC